MTIEQIKEEAKKKFGKDLTDEQAQDLLEKGGELTDEELEAVAGGILNSQDVLNATELANSFRHTLRQQQNRK